MTTIYSKTFSKEDFFNAVIALAEDAENEQVIACAEYELDKLAEAKAKAKEKRGTGSAAAGRLCSEYAKDLAKALFKVLNDKPQTNAQLVEEMAKAGCTANGKEIKNSPWVASVLGAMAGQSNASEEELKAINPEGKTVVLTMVKEQAVDSKGLIKEKLVKAYSIGATAF